MDRDIDHELIIDYINDELSSDQKRMFEERLSLDLDLVNSLRIQKEIQHAFLRMQIREQVQSIHEDAQILEMTNQNKVNGYAKNSEVAHSFVPNENEIKAQNGKNTVRKIAAVFISIIFIGGLLAWFNDNSRNPKPISTFVPPLKKDSTYPAPINEQPVEKNNSIQKIREESYSKRIEVVQLDPDVSFGFGQKKEVLNTISIKRIVHPSNGNNSYTLSSDTLFLFLTTNIQSRECLYEIQHDDESQSTLESGFYLKLEDVFYKLDKNNKKNELNFLENKSQAAELNKLIKRK